MAQDPKIGYAVQATIVSVKGECSAGHRQGESFEISCHDPAGLCGWFYHDIFPSLQTFQFGGRLPWWEKDTAPACPVLSGCGQAPADYRPEFSPMQSALLRQRPYPQEPPVWLRPDGSRGA